MRRSRSSRPRSTGADHDAQVVVASEENAATDRGCVCAAGEPDAPLRGAWTSRATFDGGFSTAMAIHVGEVHLDIVAHRATINALRACAR